MPENVAIPIYTLTESTSKHIAWLNYRDKAKPIHPRYSLDNYTP